MERVNLKNLQTTRIPFEIFYAVSGLQRNIGASVLLGNVVEYSYQGCYQRCRGCKTTTIPKVFQA